MDGVGGGIYVIVARMSISCEFEDHERSLADLRGGIARSGRNGRIKVN